MQSYCVGSQDFDVWS